MAGDALYSSAMGFHEELYTPLALYYNLLQLLLNMTTIAYSIFSPTTTEHNDNSLQHLLCNYYHLLQLLQAAACRL